jgi:thioredoxin reductase (NADPH)
MDSVRDVIVVGGACAGYTAALYAARADLSPLCIEGFAAGGQLTMTSEVDNYPGFPDGVDGPELVGRMRAQSARFGTEFVSDDVTRLDLSARPFVVEAGGRQHLARVVILATGARSRELGLAGERALQGRGVSYCGVCDAAFFRGRRVVVVGGGDAACEEAAYVARFAAEVVLVHRRGELRASAAMQRHALRQANLRLLTPYAAVDVLGVDEGRVTGVRLRHAVTGAEHDEPADGLFVAIGHEPNSELVEGWLPRDPETGYVLTEPGTTRTAVEGVFACGDVQDAVYRQAVTAAASGCMAALDAGRWVSHHHEAEEADHALR